MHLSVVKECSLLFLTSCIQIHKGKERERREKGRKREKEGERQNGMLLPVLFPDSPSPV